MIRRVALFFFLGLPLLAQEYNIAVVSMLYAHVGGHLTTMLKDSEAAAKSTA